MNLNERLSRPLQTGDGYSVTENFTTLPKLISYHRGLTKTALERFEARFDRFVITNAIFQSLKHTTIEGPKGYGDWVALVYPNAVPARVPIVTIFAAWVMRFDDLSESMTTENCHKTLYADMLAVLKCNIENGGTQKERLDTIARVYHSRPLHKSAQRQQLHQAFQQIINELLNIDQVLGIKVLEAMCFHYSVTDKKSISDIEDMDEYLMYRRIDWAASVKLALLSYALNIQLPTHVLPQLTPIVTAAMNAAVLANDYYSYTKELRNNHVRTMPYSAMSILLSMPNPIGASASPTTTSSFSNSPSITGALEIIKSLSQSYEAVFRAHHDRKQWWDVWSGSADPGKTFAEIIREDEEVMRFVDALAAFVAGNAAWSAKCPRYHGIESPETVQARAGGSRGGGVSVGQRVYSKSVAFLPQISAPIAQQAVVGTMPYFPAAVLTPAAQKVQQEEAAKYGYANAWHAGFQQGALAAGGFPAAAYQASFDGFAGGSSVGLGAAGGHGRAISDGAVLMGGGKGWGKGKGRGRG